MRWFDRIERYGIAFLIALAAAFLVVNVVRGLTSGAWNW